MTRHWSCLKKAEQIGVGKEAILAKVMEAKILINKGKVEEGRKLLKDALSEIKGSYLEPIITAEAGDAKLLEEYLKRDNPFLEDYVRFRLAMTYLAEGKKKEAKEQLMTLKGKFPSSPFARDAERVMEVMR